jgi:acetylornithine deacetylase/succinyl-diaminopimelate desuccinylase-like protein
MAHPVESVDSAAAIEVLRDIIAVDSIWGNERPLAEDLARRFRTWGFADVRLIDVPAGRPSVVARLPGRGGGKSLMLNAHIDMYELSADWTLDPWRLEERDGRLYGGGISDMKAGVGAAVAAAKHLLDTGVMLEGDLVLACVAAHFEGGVGTRAVLDAGVVTDGAIVTEPTDMTLVVAHRGAAYLDITTRGRQAHSTKPHLGVNAINQMVKVINGLAHLDLPPAHHPLLRPGHFLNVGTIRGGTKHNQIPDRCSISVDVRVHPTIDPVDVKDRVEALLENLRAQDPSFEAEVAFNPHWLSGPRIPFEADPGWPVLGVVERAFERATARPVVRAAADGWLDMAVLGTRGIETVTLGPGGGALNFADEYVLADDYLAAVRTYIAAAVEYCNQARARR